MKDEILSNLLVILKPNEIDMASRQQRSNREAKKPKREKVKVDRRRTKPKEAKAAANGRNRLKAENAELPRRISNDIA